MTNVSSNPLLLVEDSCRITAIIMPHDYSLHFKVTTYFTVLNPCNYKVFNQMKPFLKVTTFKMFYINIKFLFLLRRVYSASLVH